VPTPRQLGTAAERLVAAALIRAGWRILGRGVRVGRDELDLVALDPGPPPALVVVEVRWRQRDDFGLPEETVDRRKRTRLRRAAVGLLAGGRLADGQPLPRAAIRLDVVVVAPARRPKQGIELRHIRGVE